jgi:hypothetical protein
MKFFMIIIGMTCDSSPIGSILPLTIHFSAPAGHSNWASHKNAQAKPTADSISLFRLSLAAAECQQDRNVGAPLVC